MQNTPIAAPDQSVSETGSVQSAENGSLGSDTTKGQAPKSKILNNSVLENNAVPDAAPGTSLETYVLNVSGMKCAGCIRAVERQLLSCDGVLSTRVNLVTEVAAVECQPGQTTPQALADVLTEGGFPTQPRGDSVSTDSANADIWIERQQQERRQQVQQLAIALVLLALSLVGHLKHFNWVTVPILSNIWVHAALATLTLLGPGRRILVEGWQGLRRGSPNMNTLVGLGTLSAYTTSLVALLWPQLHWECFFDEPVMLISFILLGRTLERRARDRAAASLRTLVTLQPTTARFIPDPNTAEDLQSDIQVAVEQIQVGDWLRVLPGEKVPVDGRVVMGQTTINEAMLTGESMPVLKELDATVVAGTLNQSGVIALQVTKTGQDTVLAQLIDLVETAQTRKAPIQGLADRVAGYFTYGVLAIASLTFLFWYFVGTAVWPDIVPAALQSAHGMMANPMTSMTTASMPLLSDAALPHSAALLVSLKLAIAVLVIACPCALGLATPTAILVGSSLGAEHGLLIRGGDVLESVHRLSTIVFDKTGTLTSGVPTVTQCWSAQSDLATQTLLQLAASVEQGSQHPLGVAIQQAALGAALPLLNADAFATAAGFGVAAQVKQAHETKQVTLGSTAWLQQQNIFIPYEAATVATELAQAGQTVVYMALDGQLAGLIAIADTLRPEATSILTQLQQAGLKVQVLSGDQVAVAQAIGQQLGLQAEQVLADVKPDGKVAAIAQLQAAGERVAMVGDGINDAPALAQADVGIALNSGTDVAIETADIILIRDRLTDVAAAIQLSQATFNK
ncbi:MAG: heavy metal translocating P-type ATPase, partial [Cyanobacteria bacterium P01_H01_bin.121]